jgi:hypothetical protein
VDRDCPANRAIHDVDLLEHTIHQFRAVTGADDQLLDAWSEKSSLDPQTGATGVLLGVDHVDTSLVACPAFASTSGSPGRVDLGLSVCEELHYPGAESDIDLVRRAAEGRLHELLGRDGQHV